MFHFNQDTLVPRLGAGHCSCFTVVSASKIPPTWRKFGEESCDGNEKISEISVSGWKHKTGGCETTPMFYFLFWLAGGEEEETILNIDFLLKWGFSFRSAHVVCKLLLLQARHVSAVFLLQGLNCQRHTWPDIGTALFFLVVTSVSV